MLRTQISLTESDRVLLDRECAQTGLSISALIRNAVQQTYGSIREITSDIDLLRSAFGSWDERDQTGEHFVEELRSGTRLDDVV